MLAGHRIRILSGIGPSRLPGPPLFWAPAHWRQQYSRSNTSHRPPRPRDLQFWNSRATWRRAAVNTLRCLAGCTLGDFSAMWILQSC